MNDTPALQLQDIGYRIGGTKILHAIDLKIAPGERVALIGPNGAGKTTLFNLVSGRQNPTTGTILMNGRPTLGCSPATLQQRGLARSFQITHLFPNLTVLDNMRCALMRSFNIGMCFWRALSRHAALHQKAQLLLTQLQLTPLQHTLVKHLSYADQRTLELGLALAADSKLLLLDEPTAGMSQSESRQVVQLIRRMTEGKTLLLVEHDMGVVFDLADRIIVLVDGRMVANDAPSAIRGNPFVRDAYLGPAQRQVS